MEAQLVAVLGASCPTSVGSSRVLGRTRSVAVTPVDLGSDAVASVDVTVPLPALPTVVLPPAPVPAEAEPEPAAETVPAAEAEAETETEAAAETGAAAVPAAPAVRHRAAGGRHRRPVEKRRPRVYVAAALVGATGVGLVTTGTDGAAQADEAVEVSTSVAEQLGREAQRTRVSDVEAGRLLQEMAASRAERTSAAVRATQVQTEADRVAAEEAAAAEAAAAAAAAEAARPTVVLPVAGARLSSPFGYRWGTLHAGIDLAAPMLTPEYAAMDGVVIEAGAASGYGQVVYIQHADGIVTVYGHMEQILVEVGQTVRAGDTIALLGSRGQSTGPHLHFEVIVGGIDGEKVDPLVWLADHGVVP
ncbi:M23 family metallopeptidase [Goekera deserti]|nr:M23 family metallopeptidase [Goekera deserti]